MININYTGWRLMIVISLISCPTERITRGNYNIFKGFKFMTFKLIVIVLVFGY